MTATALTRTEYQLAVDVVAKLFVDGVIPWDAHRARAACDSAGVEPGDVRDAYNAIKRDGVEYRKPVIAEVVDLRPVVDVDPHPVQDQLERKLIERTREVTEMQTKLRQVEVQLASANSTVSEFRDRLIAGDKERTEQRRNVGKLKGTVAELTHELAVRSGTWQSPDGKPVKRIGSPRSRGNTARMREANPAPGVRRCSRCKDEKPADQEHFHLKNERTGQLSSICRECRVTYSRERYLNVKRIEAMNRAGIEFVIDAGDDFDGLQCTSCEKPLKVGDLVHGKTRLDHVDCKVPGG